MHFLPLPFFNFNVVLKLPIVILCSVILSTVKGGNLSFYPPMADAPRTGNVKTGLIFAYYNEFVLNDDAKNRLVGLFKTQAEFYMSWASYEQLNLDIEIFYHPLNKAEKKNDGSCRDHPGFIYDEVDGYDQSNYLFGQVEVLTTQGCGGTCASYMNGIKCTTMYDYLVQENCDYTLISNLCEKGHIHELLHALDLGYHVNMYECTQTEIDAYPDITWRDCENVEYGGRLDVLGSGNKYGKISFGVAARLRYDLYWLDGDDITVVTKRDSISSWTETSTTILLNALDTLEYGSKKAAIIRFTDARLQGLGNLWLEYRGGYYFDSNVPVNNNGIIAFHDGNNLIDLDPSDNYSHVTLDVGNEWFDPASGLKVKTLSTDGETARVKVTFTSPPTCKRDVPVVNLPGFYGGYRVYLSKADNLETYQNKNEDGWGAVTIDSWLIELYSYFNKPEINNYKVILSYEVSVRNNDSATCSKSTINVRGISLPDGWRFDSHPAHPPLVSGQATHLVRFSVAVPSETPDGAYEILIEVYKEEDQMKSPELYRLWLCVGGFNPWFFAIANDRHPPWKCYFGGSNVGVEPEPAINPRDNPTASPTKAPCTDSNIRFKVQWNGKRVSRSCNWIANKLTNARCAIDGVSDICADTCGTCNNTCQDSTLRIKVTLNGKGAMRSCTWVANKKTEARCALDGVANACRATCGQC